MDSVFAWAKILDDGRIGSCRAPLVLRAAGHAIVVALLVLALAGCDTPKGKKGGSGTSAASARPSAATVKPSKSVQEAQTLLAELGYDPGPADGLMGARTKDAIREYQKAAGLPVDGRVTRRLIAHLKTGRPRNVKTLPRVPAPVAKPPAVPLPTARPEPPTRPKPPAKPVSDIFRADYGDIQPVYTLGDAFVWSSGQADSVVRVGADNVVWRSSDGTGRTAYRSFTAPPVEWQSNSEEGSAKIEIDPLLTWPLEAGAGIRFEVVSSRAKPGQSKPRESVETWSCRRTGEKTITVPAGRFETILVSCSRKPGPKGEWRKRIWYYAPAVRHFVRRDSFDAAGRRRRIRLVSLRPGWKDWPPAARTGLDWAIQDTLTNGAKGIGVEWGSSGVGTKLTILPGLTFTAKGKRRCRKFALVQAAPMAPRVFPAIACWDAKRSKWLVPGLDEGAAPVTAVR
jgi:hypothetical protein